MVERERFQLVVGLGEGPEGQRLREVLDRAAERAGRPVTVWAREVLLAAAGDAKSEGPVDPIAEVRIKGNATVLIDLRVVGGMYGGNVMKVGALIGGQWEDLHTNKPDELIERWKRVHRWGLL